jgi:hypothetical protein
MAAIDVDALPPALLRGGKDTASSDSMLGCERHAKRMSKITIHRLLAIPRQLYLKQKRSQRMSGYQVSVITVAVFGTKPYDKKARQHVSANHGMGWHFPDFRLTQDTARRSVVWPASPTALPGTCRELRGLDFQLFAGSVSVSHAIFLCRVDFGDPVELGGLHIAPSTLLHNHLHDVSAIPLEIAGAPLAIADQLQRNEDKLFRFYERKDFSVDLLEAKLRAIETVVRG